jgi:ABC-2 type transport system permease protein
MRTLTVVLRAAHLSSRRLLADRSTLATVALIYLMVTAVLSGLWARAAEGAGGSLAGYSAAALIWYIATAEAAVNGVPVRLIEQIGTDIATGQIEPELLRPANPVVVRIATEVGAALPRLGTCMGVGVIYSLAVAGRPPSLAAATLAVPALGLAVVGNLVAQHAFASAAFWLRDTRSAYFLYQKLVFVLGGMLLPLEVLPRPLEITAKALPFAAFSYAPARLASGHLEPWWLAIQVAWLVVLAGATVTTFGAGERRLIRVGS